ncbi:MAG TPA: SH3 domain-containing protein [Polyangiaceae bacterium]|nr:SH3 domain-containing protein [Polyangiaceae bacterium]
MRFLVAGVLLAMVLSVSSGARADEEAFARVVVAETELRSGPGVSHRVIQRARRGETFVIEQRETSGFWLQVLLPDGRTAYLLGDTIEVVSADEGLPDAPSRPGLFAPPALQEARGGFALLGGVYDLDGYGEVRPALVLAPAIALEPYVGIALEPDSRRFVYGLAGTLNLAPDWAIAPYVTLGAGGVHEQPKDEFVRKERSWFHARVGGGLLISLRLRILLRLEATNVVLFTEDDYENVQSYIGGLGTYF